jgi:hypothetical protein
VDLAFLSDPARGDDHDTRTTMTIRDLASRALRAIPLVAVLGLGLTLSACDKCFDFPWDKPGSCKNGPAPN